MTVTLSVLHQNSKTRELCPKVYRRSTLHHCNSEGQLEPPDNQIVMANGNIEDMDLEQEEALLRVDEEVADQFQNLQVQRRAISPTITINSTSSVTSETPTVPLLRNDNPPNGGINFSAWRIPKVQRPVPMTSESPLQNLRQMERLQNLRQMERQPRTYARMSTGLPPPLRRPKQQEQQQQQRSAGRPIVIVTDPRDIKATISAMIPKPKQKPRWPRHCWICNLPGHKANRCLIQPKKTQESLPSNEGGL